MKTVATFTTPEEAHLFRAFLGSRGITGHLLDENFVQWFWKYSNAIGGVRVSVSDEDGDEAVTLHQEYMTALRQGPYPLEPVRALPLVVLMTLLVGVPLILFGRHQIRTKPATD